MSSIERPILGIDIGGTKTAICVGTAEGEILERGQFKTEPARGPVAACDRIAEEVATLVDRHGELHDTIGVSAPGPLSSCEGRFLNPPNMPSWHGFHLVDALAQRTERRVEMMNDANAAAWAEWRFGAGRGSQTMLFFTMSTGMGAGLIVGGRLHEGADDLAGEVGHTRVQPDGPAGFGRRGSLEGFCSGTGIAQLAVLRLHQARQREERSVLLQGDRDFRCIDVPELGEAARRGDAVALDVFREVGVQFGHYCADVVDLLNPDVIVVGTIGRLFHDLILPHARQQVIELCHPRAAQRVEFKPAELGKGTGDMAAISAVLARHDRGA